MVDEEEKTQGTQTQTEGKPAEAPAEEGNPKNVGLVEGAEKAAIALKAENDRKERLLTEERALQARKELSGQAIAGMTPKQKTANEKWAEDAKERYAGTGLDPTEDDSPTVYN